MHLLLLILAVLGGARADHLTSLEPASPLEWNASLAGTWGRIQFNQHLASHSYGRGATYAHVLLGGNVRAPWRDVLQPCALPALPAPPVGCLSLIPDAGDVLVKQGDRWTLDAAEPVGSVEAAAEILRYQHLASSRPRMLRTRVRSVPVLLVAGGRLQYDGQVVESGDRRGGRGRLHQLRAGPMFGGQWGWLAGTVAWTPAGAPLGGSLGNDRELPVDLWETTAWAPGSFLLFLDGDFPVDRKGVFDWISPELRFRRIPIHAHLAGGERGERAWVHELTWQLVAIVY
jgi:hypothetical protein